MEFEQGDRQELQTAHELLENPGLVAKISHFVGNPIESSLKKLPSNVRDAVGEITRRSLEHAYGAALATMSHNALQEQPVNLRHKLITISTGALGGAFGTPGIVVELPITTTIILRSIADIARSHGESLKCPETKRQCLAVFTFGGKSKSDDAAESGYYAARIVLNNQVPAAVAKFIPVIAERFAIQVSQKLAAQAVPVIGALGGATINALFMDHFQSMARGHFTVRKLERKYGPEAVEKEYNALKCEQRLISDS